MSDAAQEVKSSSRNVEYEYPLVVNAEIMHTLTRMYRTRTFVRAAIESLQALVLGGGAWLFVDGKEVDDADTRSMLERYFIPFGRAAIASLVLYGFIVYKLEPLHAADGDDTGMLIPKLIDPELYQLRYRINKDMSGYEYRPVATEGGTISHIFGTSAFSGGEESDPFSKNTHVYAPYPPAKKGEPTSPFSTLTREESITTTTEHNLLCADFSQTNPVMATHVKTANPQDPTLTHEPAAYGAYMNPDTIERVNTEVRTVIMNARRQERHEVDMQQMTDRQQRIGRLPRFDAASGMLLMHSGILEQSRGHANMYQFPPDTQLEFVSRAGFNPYVMDMLRSYENNVYSCVGIPSPENFRSTHAGQAPLMLQQKYDTGMKWQRHIADGLFTPLIDVTGVRIVVRGKRVQWMFPSVANLVFLLDLIKSGLISARSASRLLSAHSNIPADMLDSGFEEKEKERENEFQRELQSKQAKSGDSGGGAAAAAPKQRPRRRSKDSSDSDTSSDSSEDEKGGKVKKREKDAKKKGKKGGREKRKRKTAADENAK